MNPEKCCKKFLFQQKEFKYEGQYEGYDMYKGPNSLYIFFHTGMGFWMLGNTPGTEYAYAFANYHAGVCVGDIVSWQVNTSFVYFD